MINSSVAIDLSDYILMVPSKVFSSILIANPEIFTINTNMGAQKSLRHAFNKRVKSSFTKPSVLVVHTYSGNFTYFYATV
jgi:hypothetical protein